ncbi:hypothetical protein A9Q99_00510 [Gammaproteobacteria bacterium 45_16_T64]|nr:hypothetical protein A9Q99_00510 [Gammaproteobacteria bacterium 45_16_T64]
MRNRNALILGCSLATMAFTTTANATPINLGDAKYYNGFFSDSFNSTANDSQGALAIGGNAQLQGYTVNTLGQSNVPAIVVGGDLQQDGGDIQGDAFVGGTYTGVNGAGINGTLAQNIGGGLPVDFDSTFLQLNDLSDTLSTLGTSATSSWGQVDYNGDGTTDQQIFNLTESSFESAWGFFANDITQDQEVIVNVGGTHIDIDSADYLVKATDWSWIGNDGNILFNFYEAEEIILGGAFHGTILATDADIIASGGSVDGQVIAKSWQGATQLNAPLFQHSIDEPIEVPAPSVVLLFIGGLFSFRLFRRKIESI